MEICLPYPPTVNHLWRRVGNRTLVSKEAREYRKAVADELAVIGVKPIDGPLAVDIDVYPPDHRRRDLDNLQKALLDSLQHGGVYRDDNQIADLRIRRCETAPGGRVDVKIAAAPPLPPAPASAPAPKAQLKKQRTCLKCGKPFKSSRPGNRICNRCNRRNSELKLTERELQEQRGSKRHNQEPLGPSACRDSVV